MKRRFALSMILLAGLFATTFTSCKKDDDDDDEKATVETLKASFTYDGNYRPTPGIVKFTNNSTLATSYLWDFGDGNTSEDANPEHEYAAAGEYKVELVATGSDGATKTVSHTIEMLGACTKVSLKTLFLYKEAVTSGDGTEYDNDGTGADPTFKIFNSNDEEIFDLEQYMVDFVFDDTVNTAAVFPSDQLNKLPYTLPSLTETYKIVFYDYDQNKGNLEPMCEATFKPQDYIPTGEFDPYPNMFEIETPHIAMNISWTE